MEIVLFHHHHYAIAITAAIAAALHLQINGRHVNHFGHSKIEISDALVSRLHTLTHRTHTHSAQVVQLQIICFVKMNFIEGN